MKHLSTLAALAVLCVGATPSLSGKSNSSIELTVLSSVAAITPGVSAAEIVAHDPGTQRIFVVNAAAAKIDVFDISDPADPQVVRQLVVDVDDEGAFADSGAVANSVAVKDGIIAVAVEANPKTEPGKVVFFDNSLSFLSQVEVGAQPDMVTFTHNGRYVLTANEGEPSEDYAVDPEGSVSIIDLSRGAAQATVRTAGFGAFNELSREELFGTGAGPKPAIRIFGPDATVAQNLEPEFITVSHDSATAWVTLQENNALAIIDIASGTVTAIKGLGVKDHSLASNALDASDKDSEINIRNWPVKGFYLPDAIASFKVGNETYLVLANEGDARDWDGYSEETRIGSMALDPTVFPTAVATELKKPSNLGRLRATTAQGDTDGNKIFKEIYTFGARSFSIRSATGALLWDSGNQFEKITAEQNPAFFNSNHEINKFDDRSDDKGPEPEGVTLGKAFGRDYAFIALERIGGVMVYDVSNPTAPEFVQYINNRDFTKSVTSVESGDLGPEGLIFISEENSPNGKPLLVVANEISGTTTIFEIAKKK